MNLTKSLFCFIVCLMPVAPVFGHAAITYPVGGETFPPFKHITIRWEEAIDHGSNNWDLYYSLNGGVTWEEIVLDLDESTLEYEWTTPFAETSEALVKVVQDNDDYVKYEGISGKFTIKSDSDPGEPPSVVTGIEDISDSGLELTNFPNPFSNSTTIQFGVPYPGTFTLNIYSVEGKVLFRRSENLPEAKTNDIVWETTEIPGGIYICKLTFGDKIITRRLVLSP